MMKTIGLITEAATMGILGRVMRERNCSDQNCLMDLRVVAAGQSPWRRIPLSAPWRRGII
jgi:hypothetical protein